MISFVSTYPPAMCGIGTYTYYLTRVMPKDSWNVITFKPDEFSICDIEPRLKEDNRVNHWISLDNPSLPKDLTSEVVWFQHSFGMWGRVNTHFLKLINEAKRRGKKVGASFHTIHFQSEETPWGMQEKEYELLKETLPLLDFITVFTSGAKKAVINAFPEFREKVVVLRHGVHNYPKVSKEYARERLFNYLSQLPSIPVSEKIRLKGIEKSCIEGSTLLLGNYGFITQDKDPILLYEIGRKVQEMMPNRIVITLFIGKIQERKDKKRELYIPILEKLKSIHDGKQNLFYEEYLPEGIFPYAFRALDVALFWCTNATQSGRMAHAQGTGVPIAGRDLEGIGETLKLSGLPVSETMDELAFKIVEIIKNPVLKDRMERQSYKYAEKFSFFNQAQKHILIEEAVIKGDKLPLLDEEMKDDIHTGKVSYWRPERFGESRRGGELHP